MGILSNSKSEYSDSDRVIFEQWALEIVVFSKDRFSVVLEAELTEPVVGTSWGVVIE